MVRAELAGDDLEVAADGGQRLPVDHLADAGDERLAGRRDLTADDDPRRREEADQPRQHPAEQPPRLADLVERPLVAGAHEPHDVAAAARLQPDGGQLAGDRGAAGQRGDTAAVAARAHELGLDRDADVADLPRRVVVTGVAAPGDDHVDVYARAGDRAFLERVYPGLERQLAYLRDRRDVAGDGLAAIVHPWESLDNSPMWDEALAALHVGALPEYRRADVNHVDAAERPTAADYDRYVYLAAWYRDRGYRDSDRPPFALEDPLFNAIVCWGWEALAEIAEVVGADPAPHRRDAARVRDGLLARLWDPAEGGFWARDLRAGRLVRRRTVASLAPLVDPGLPAEVAAALVGTLRSPAFRSPLGVPTYDLNAPDFDPCRYWRGPVWINVNWLIGRGLRAHGYAELAGEVDAGTVALVRRAGFREYFDPITGKGRGADDFSWTAALLLEAL
jgi:Glycosyl hydrolase family 63 C-terminal domain